MKLLKLIIVILALAGVYYFITKDSTKTPTSTSHAVERTFAMIKPDAVAAGNADAIIDIIKENGFTVVAMKKAQLSRDEAATFYAVHKERPFFNDLVEFVTSGPVVLLALEKEDAVKAWRTLMGATDPLKAEPGTIRHQFGTSIGSNAVHGSDAPETAHIELGLFFPELK